MYDYISEFGLIFLIVSFIIMLIILIRIFLKRKNNSIHGPNPKRLNDRNFLGKLI